MYKRKGGFTKKKRSYRRKGTGAKSLAKKVAKIQKQITHVQDVKEWTTANQFATVANTVAIYNLTAIAQGAANGQRNGLFVINKALGVNINLENNTAGTAYMRCILFRWNDDYNSPPTLGGVFSPDLVGGVVPPNAVYNYVNKDKFHVLADRLITLQSSTLALKGASTQMFVPKMKTKIKYTDDIGTHYEKGNLFMLFYCNCAVGITMTSQFRYTDG